jgi:hypothetical protein
MTFIPAGRPRVEILEAQQMLRAAGGSALSNSPTVIWRPGGTTAGNVYATWPEVVAAIARVNGIRTIGVDTDFGAAVIPAGAWDLSPVGISGPVELVNASKLNSALATSTPNITIYAEIFTGA